jgi:hypothetical protein
VTQQLMPQDLKAGKQIILTPQNKNTPQKIKVR